VGRMDLPINCPAPTLGGNLMVRMNRKPIRETFVFMIDNAQFSRDFDLALLNDDEYMERFQMGQWERPFNNSFPVGEVESFEQSDIGGCLVSEYGKVVEYIVF
jgi:hypothetical protein